MFVAGAIILSLVHQASSRQPHQVECDDKAIKCCDTPRPPEKNQECLHAWLHAARTNFANSTAAIDGFDKLHDQSLLTELDLSRMEPPECRCFLKDDDESRKAGKNLVKLCKWDTSPQMPLDCEVFVGRVCKERTMAEFLRSFEIGDSISCAPHFMFTAENKPLLYPFIIPDGQLSLGSKNFVCKGTGIKREEFCSYILTCFLLPCEARNRLPVNEDAFQYYPFCAHSDVFGLNYCQHPNETNIVAYLNDPSTINSSACVLPPLCSAPVPSGYTFPPNHFTYEYMVRCPFSPGLAAPENPQCEHICSSYSEYKAGQLANGTFCRRPPICEEKQKGLNIWYVNPVEHLHTQEWGCIRRCTVEMSAWKIIGPWVHCIPRVLCPRNVTVSTESCDALPICSDKIPEEHYHCIPPLDIRPERKSILPTAMGIIGVVCFFVILKLHYVMYSWREERFDEFRDLMTSHRLVEDE